MSTKSEDPIRKTTVRISLQEEQALRQVFSEDPRESLPRLIRKAMRDAILFEQTKAVLGKGKYVRVRLR